MNIIFLYQYSDLVISQSDSPKDIKDKNKIKEIFRFILTTNYKKMIKNFIILWVMKRKLKVLDIIQQYQHDIFKIFSKNIYSGGYHMNNYICKDKLCAWFNTDKLKNENLQT